MAPGASCRCGRQFFFHPERRRALEIARHLARATGLPLDAESLVKCRATRPQSESSRKERRKNARNAFLCQDDLQGTRIWLVDDVLTTGATLDQAARVLKLHGAREIVAVVVARTPKGRGSVLFASPMQERAYPAARFRRSWMASHAGCVGGVSIRRKSRPR
ncbi:MAG: hypothetical protein LBO00_06485 [Zoogloeaceae bacterium]|nr:hypothetical protein [Zoogloeaceae bacterium]